MIHGLFGFSGRLRRLAYLGYGVLLLAVLVALQVPLALARHHGASIGIVLAVALPALAATVTAWWVGLALPVKRLHDLDRSGWVMAWYFAALVLGAAFVVVVSLALPGTPWVAVPLGAICLGNFAFQMWLLFAPGTRGPNRFDRYGNGRAEHGSPAR